MHRNPLFSVSCIVVALTLQIACFMLIICMIRTKEDVLRSMQQKVLIL